MPKNNSIIPPKPIAAIATPVGEGGIAVNRVSRKDTIAVINNTFRGANLTLQKSHKVHLGKIINQRNELVDHKTAQNHVRDQMNLTTHITASFF